MRVEASQRLVSLWLISFCSSEKNGRKMKAENITNKD